MIEISFRFSYQGTQERVRTAVVNESSVFEPLKFYCSLNTIIKTEREHMSQG